VLKMILESHSLKTAIARFHLTTPQALRELQTMDEAGDAARQVATLQKELKAIEDVDRADFAALERLGFGRDGRATTSTVEAVTDGAAAPADSAVDADDALEAASRAPVEAPSTDMPHDG
jgi:hypothetical protein